MKIKGVEEIIEKSDEYVIKISSKDIAKDVFKYVSKCENNSASFELTFSEHNPMLNGGANAIGGTYIVNIPKSNKKQKTFKWISVSQEHIKAYRKEEILN